MMEQKRDANNASSERASRMIRWCLAFPAELRHVSVTGARLEVLPAAALDLPLRTLVLAADGLAHLHPGAFASMSGTLASLDLGHNELAAVPTSALRPLRVLNWLNLQNNYIREVGEELQWGPLTESLSTLSLNNNQVVELRERALSALRRLSRLELDNNRLRYIAASALPAALAHLQLEDNLLLAVPCDALGNVPRLSHLHLRNNGIAISETSLCNRSAAIEVLDLAHNGLVRVDRLRSVRALRPRRLLLDLNEYTTIPIAAFDDRRLESLSMSHNKLTEISEAALEVFKLNLERLELDHNSIERLPVGLWELRGLRHLSLSYNALRSVSALPPDLYSLSLAGNFFLDFPAALKNLTSGVLTVLDLSYNLISDLSPGDFDDWSGGLVALDMKGNRLTRLRAGVFPASMPVREIILSFNDLYHVDPDTFGDVSSSLRLLEFSTSLFSGEFPCASLVEKLSWLSYDNNNIHVLTSADLQSYPALEYLNLEFNKIIEMPSEYRPANLTYKLKEIRLAHNFISKLSSSFLTEATELQSLDLFNNRISNVTERYFTDLPNLIYLNLAENLIEYIGEDAFCNLPALRVLELQNNSLVDFSVNFFNNVSNEETKFSLNISHNVISEMRGGRQLPIGILDASYNALSVISTDFFSAVGPH